MLKDSRLTGKGTKCGWPQFREIAAQSLGIDFYVFAPLKFGLRRMHASYLKTVCAGQKLRLLLFSQFLIDGIRTRQ